MLPRLQAAANKGEWPKRPLLDAYDVEEKGGFVWLFYGSRGLPAEARPPIPHVPELGELGELGCLGQQPRGSAAGHSRLQPAGHSSGSKAGTRCSAPGGYHCCRWYCLTPAPAGAAAAAAAATAFLELLLPLMTWSLDFLPLPSPPPAADNPEWKAVYEELEFECNHFGVFENAFDFVSMPSFQHKLSAWHYTA